MQNNFALLRYLPFSTVETISHKDIAVKNSATSPLINTKSSRNPNPNTTSSAFLLPCITEIKLHRSTQVGAVGQPRAKADSSANANFQSSTNTLGAPPITAQNLTSRILKLEKLHSDEKIAYTSISAAVHSQYFFFYDKNRQLELGNSDATFWKIQSVKFVIDSAKMTRPSSDPLIEPTSSFTSLMFRTHAHGYIFFIKL